MSCCIPVSIGELFDKYSILQIKHEKIKDPLKLLCVQKEMTYLKTHIDQFPLQPKIYNQLLEINQQLWKVEDDIREKESNQEFDEFFISLARSVYRLNDERARIKNEINLFFESDIVEVKSYFQK